MIVKVLEDKCSGCRSCVEACPQEAIEMRGDKAFVLDSCMGCEACVWACGQEAIVPDEKASQQMAMR